MMKLSELLHIPPGITAILGGGGKTTLMLALGRELSQGARVILTTTTKIYPPENVPTLLQPGEGALRQALTEKQLLCLGAPAPEGKLSESAIPVQRLAQLADYVLVEADGSRGLPMKAHGPGEPVIPPESGAGIYVIGAGGFGKKIREVCHRGGLFAQKNACTLESEMTPELAARGILGEGWGETYFLNQVETAQDYENAARFQRALGCPVIAGSLIKGEFRCLS